MAIMTRSGRAALADAIRQRPLHLAWGSGNADWETVAPEFTGTFASNTFDLPNGPVEAVSVTSTDGNTTYVSGDDYTVDTGVGRITRIVTGTISEGQQVKVNYTRLTPAPEVEQEALVAEIGRREVDEVAFVLADDQGAIVAPTGRFTLSSAPTNHLFVRVRFDFLDAPDATIREQGLFVGTVTDENLPGGQRYFAPGELTDAGILLIAQNTVPIIRQPSTRETFEFVVTF